MASEWLVAAGLLGALLAAQELGYRAGVAYAKEEGKEGSGQVGAAQGATLGLLGLLLGFSFSGASARFLERQDLITAEANAIGTAYLRADLLDEPQRKELRGSLQRYTEHRLEWSKHVRRGAEGTPDAEVARLHEAIWAAAIGGVNAKPGTMVGVLPPVNEVIDLHSLRIAAGRKHLPILVLGLLVVSSVLAMAVMGYGSGLTRRRHTVLLASLAVVIGIALWTTIDLDHPRAGVIQLSDAPLEALKFGDAKP